MADDRQIPGWLRVGLNLLAIFGVLATIMGWIKPVFGIAIVLFAVAYVGWEIAPWATPRIHRRPVMSLIIFMLAGATAGAAAWWTWKLSTKPMPQSPSPIAAQVVWPAPAPITAGTPLSSIQLNATSSADGVFTYDPPVGTILPVGYSRIEATFHPKDQSKYTVYIDHNGITVTEPPRAVAPATLQLKPEIATDVPIVHLPPEQARPAEQNPKRILSAEALGKVLLSKKVPCQAAVWNDGTNGPANLATQIGIGLQMGGWHPVGGGVKMADPLWFPDDLTVEISSARASNDDRSREAADALIEALKDQGIVASLRFATQQFPANFMRVKVAGQ